MSHAKRQENPWWDGEVFAFIKGILKWITRVETTKMQRYVWLLVLLPLLASLPYLGYQEEEAFSTTSLNPAHHHSSAPPFQTTPLSTTSVQHTITPAPSVTWRHHDMTTFSLFTRVSAWRWIWRMRPAAHSSHCREQLIIPTTITNLQKKTCWL